MKKLACLLMAFILLGCQVSTPQIKNDITNEINTMAKSAPTSYKTMNKPFYSYYLPKDVGRIDSNDISSLLSKDGSKIIMNFNPNSIVIHDYYHKDEIKGYEENTIDETYKHYYRSNGTFLGSDYRYHNYSIQIAKLDETDFLLYLDLAYVNFTTVVKEVQLASFIHSMFIIGKSLTYDSSEIIAHYSLQSTLDSIKQDLDEFNEELPNNGSLSDLIEKNK